MISLLLAAVIIVNVEFDGQVLECRTAETITYYPAEKFIAVDQCKPSEEEVIFADGFE